MEQLLLALAATMLLLQAAITLWRQREHTTNAAHLRLLAHAHSHRDLEERMQSIARELHKELGKIQVSVLVYTGEHTAIVQSSRTQSQPPMHAKEARLLDHDIHKSLVDSKRLPARSHIVKLLKSYKIHYVAPLNHADTRVGYIFLHAPKGLALWQRQVIELCQNDLAHALASALRTHAVHSRNSLLEQEIATNIHEHSVKAQQALDLDTARDEFVSMASHQLRTPLTSVKGYLSMVLEGDAGEITKEQRKLLSEAFLSSERMVRLISDFLNVSRIQTGKFMVDKVEADVAKIIKQEIKQLQINAKARGLTIKADVPKTPVLAQLDDAKIRQVIMNFIDNAIYYSPEKTTITVSLKQTASRVEIAVKDQGIGVPREEQPKLFGKFYRASNARLQRPDGTGVGLYLAKQIIDGHKGKIIFSSTPGQGSTFGFSVPKK